MGYALYISLESEIEGFDHTSDLCGKSIGNEEAFFASKLNKSFSNFISVNMEEMEDFFDNPEDIPEIEEEWFTPVEGLQMISEHLALAEKNPADLEDAEGVIEDLSTMKRILQKALEHEVRWHFSCDI